MTTLRWRQQFSVVLLGAVILLALSGCGSAEESKITTTDGRSGGIGDEATAEPGSVLTPEMDGAGSGLPLIVYWLGESYDPNGDLPPLIHSPHEPVARGLNDFDLGIQYTIETDDPGQFGGVVLGEARSERWESLFVERVTTGGVQTFAPYWDNPCWSRREIALEPGRATIFFRDDRLPDQPSGDVISAEVKCAPEYAELYAHVFFGETVVWIRIIDTASLASKSDGTPGWVNPYFSHAGIDAVIHALQPRPADFVYVGATATAEAFYAEATAYASTSTIVPPATVEPTPTLPEVNLMDITDVLLLPSDFEASGEFGWERVGVEPPAELVPGAGALVCNINDPLLRFTYPAPITQVFEHSVERTVIVQSIGGTPVSSPDEAVQAISGVRQAQACGSWTDGAGQTWIIESMDVSEVSGDEVIAFHVLNAGQPERKPQVAVIAVRQGPIVTITTQIETGTLRDGLAESLAAITGARVANLLAASAMP